MIETFTALLFAHVLADFVLQTGWIVANKRKPHVMLLHGAIVLVTLQLAVGSVTALPLLALAAAHLAIDATKTYAMRGSGIGPFLGDQAAHMATLVATAFLAPQLWAEGIWVDLVWLPAAMALLAGFIITVRAGAFAIGALMAPWATADLPKGLDNGGQLIGILERGLIFLLLLVGQPAGVGFLIAAKSVLRFDTTAKDQSAGEYVIIGTLASFGWALASGYATLALLGHLPPLGILPQSP
ncbi:MAG: DUF3307 domain-containing protein [Yoonia sp.]|uniref:DUF3307 domain-containing protein n=1 Tax=Yoonia sp. TaxID=2212373 RepID=UPI003EF378D3